MTDSMPDAMGAAQRRQVALSRWDNGRFIEVNESFTRMTGFARTDVVGRSIAEIGLFVGPYDRASLVGHLERGERMLVASRLDPEHGR